jgi:hypothetical protein
MLQHGNKASAIISEIYKCIKKYVKKIITQQLNSRRNTNVMFHATFNVEYVEQ